MDISNIVDKTLNIKVNNETNLSNNTLTVINNNQKDISVRKRTKMYDPDYIGELSQYINNADSHTLSMTQSKLELITEQIQMLQAQAQNILEKAKKDMLLTHARCNFVRVPGNIYHLYQKDLDNNKLNNYQYNNNQNSNNNIYTYFSMLSPKDYNFKNKDNFIGSFYLRNNMSWIPIEDLDEQKKSNKINFNLLGISKDKLLIN